MNYKLAHFLHWFFVNEQIVTQLPNLRFEKQLFWLGWLQWHLDFYLPNTSFVLLFAPNQKLFKLYLIGLLPPQQQQVRNKKKLKRFRLTFSPAPAAIRSMEKFERQIIFDVVNGQLETVAQNKVKFLEIDLGEISLYCNYKSTAIALTLADQEFSNMKTDFINQTFVQLPRLTIEDNSMSRLIEFNNYIDLLNADNQNAKGLNKPTADDQS
ncbi:hypothetical protein [Flavobacterium sp.]|uniref:hypothetical protein n=1 Tax=Flavobacterium sp. TaxID=239 RepID=UPI00120145D3|nr:hypothetical protein [Flavobacterium sp.]RZJ71730.1 MAG: hypothetical protein EOO49_08685 [Flavobacterium sp.]